MKEEINKSIEDFSKGNEDLVRILTLFSAQMIIIVSKYITRGIFDNVKTMSDSIFEVSNELITKK